MSNENIGPGAFSQATDLKKRILFTVIILVIYRLGTYVPLAGIDPVALKEIMSTSQKGLLGMFNMFSGGAVGRMAIFTCKTYPWFVFFYVYYIWIILLMGNNLTIIHFFRIFWYYYYGLPSFLRLTY